MLETTDLLKSANSVNGRLASDLPESVTEPAPVRVPSSSHSSDKKDPYGQVVFVLLALALLGTAGAVYAGRLSGNPALLDTAVTLGLSAAILIGVRATRTARITKQPTISWKHLPPRVTEVLDRIWRWYRSLGPAGIVGVTAACLGLAATVSILRLDLRVLPPSPLLAGVVAAICLIAAGVAATAVRYLSEIEPASLPEARGLCRGARLVAWILVLAAVSVGLAWAGQPAVLRILHVAVLLVNCTICYGLFKVRQPATGVPPGFPLDLGITSVLGARTNVLASLLDAAERQLGIDLRSTWALTVLRRSLEPLALGLLLIGWLSTSLTVVGLEEQGIVERLGVPADGQLLMPGLHAHWPWPVDRVYWIPVLRVQEVEVGHESKEQSGPENVLWARQHAANEYTLLLGNGRDLITIDAAVQFRIVDARAWRYKCQNPAEALRAIAYRAVMRSTVNRTLNDALSENVATLTADMRAAIQRDADALGIGVDVLTFTVGGMHPPVLVAASYQAVISSEIGKTTKVLNAQVSRIQTLPFAESEVLRTGNAARAESAEALAKAAGEAWSFRTLESQYRAAPADYFFRRRLETLENGLSGRRFVVVDNRFERDGGQLWIVP
jgi:regulator of protease activity HflC (stomatin/prohibitin superfamily)